MNFYREDFINYYQPIKDVIPHRVNYFYFQIKSMVFIEIGFVLLQVKKNIILISSMLYNLQLYELKVRGVNFVRGVKVIINK